MKLLILVRHSKAEPINPDINDFQRKLKKKRGVQDAKLMSGILKEKNLFPDLIVSSPAYRAKQTAGIFAETFNYMHSKIDFKDYLYDYYTTDDFVDMVNEFDERYNIVMIVGHNPTIAEVGNRLSGGFNGHMPTTGILGISFDISNWIKIEPGNGKLLFVEYPSKYK